MQNKSVIMSFILGFASKCEVLEPEWLRNDVKQELLNIAKLYKEDENND
jgi:predicted DNA-binding transcriptional regulator YafY